MHSDSAKDFSNARWVWSLLKVEKGLIPLPVPLHLSEQHTGCAHLPLGSLPPAAQGHQTPG